MRTEVRQRWVFRLSLRRRLDGLSPVRGRVVHRLLHRDGRPVAIRVVQLAKDRVLFGARADDRELAEWGIERMRLALGIDQDLRPFYERFRSDPLIGPALRANPGLRVSGRPDPFEALAWSVCEQLIEYERAAAIERRLVAAIGRHCPETGLRDAPCAQVIADQAPARLASFGLSEARALTLSRAAREVASGRVELAAGDHESGWQRLRRIRGIGAWTLQTLALTGQGRLDQLPAGDVGYLKLVGRLCAGGDPYARATVEEVERFFAPYKPWCGLAGLHALSGAGGGARLRLTARNSASWPKE
ncbi:MAG: DNA-3-methyladenine glycosylase family protein [Solirubrobacteraceae bacterium]